MNRHFLAGRKTGGELLQSGDVCNGCLAHLSNDIAGHDAFDKGFAGGGDLGAQAGIAGVFVFQAGDVQIIPDQLLLQRLPLLLSKPLPSS